MSYHKHIALHLPVVILDFDLCKLNVSKYLWVDIGRVVVISHQVFRNAVAKHGAELVAMADIEHSLVEFHVRVLVEQKLFLDLDSFVNVKFIFNHSMLSFFKECLPLAFIFGHLEKFTAFLLVLYNVVRPAVFIDLVKFRKIKLKVVTFT
jgi:hypothetical protein